MNAHHFAEQDAQLGRLVRVHGFAKPRWAWVALAALMLVYIVPAAVQQFNALRVLMGLGLVACTALLSIARIPKRVGIYELGMVIHSPLFFSFRTIFWRDVLNVRVERKHSNWISSAHVEIQLTNRTFIHLGSGVDDVEGIANAASYQRGTTSTPQVASPWG